MNLLHRGALKDRLLIHLFRSKMPRLDHLRRLSGQTRFGKRKKRMEREKGTRRQMSRSTTQTIKEATRTCQIFRSPTRLSSRTTQRSCRRSHWTRRVLELFRGLTIMTVSYGILVVWMRDVSHLRRGSLRVHTT